MDIESYFDFQAPNDVRIKGSRIGIESVLYEHIFRARTPEEIAMEFPTINLEQVYATLLYYQQNKVAVDRYMAEWIEHGRRAREEQAKDPRYIRLREKLAEYQAAQPAAGR